jgi:hypothetical protein
MTLMDDTDVLPITAPHDDIAIVLPSRRVKSAGDLKATLRHRLRYAPFVVAIGLVVLAMTAGFALWGSGAWSEPRQQRQFKKYESLMPGPRVFPSPFSVFLGSTDRWRLALELRDLICAMGLASHPIRRFQTLTATQ